MSTPVDVREPYTTTTQGVVWQCGATTAGDADSEVLQFPEQMDHQVRVWRALSEPNAAVNKAFRLAQVRVDAGGEGRIEMEWSRAARPPDDSQWKAWLPEVLSFLRFRKIAPTELESVSTWTDADGGDVVAFSPLEIRERRWRQTGGLWPEETGELDERSGSTIPGASTSTEDLDHADTLPIPILWRRLAKGWRTTGNPRKGRRRNRSPLRIGALTVASGLTVVIAAGLAAVHTHTAFNKAPEAISPPTPLSCLSSREASTLLEGILRDRAEAMTARSLTGLAAVEGWDLVLMDAVSLAKRHSDGRAFPVPTYTVEVNSLVCSADENIELVATVGGVSLEGRSLHPATLRMTLVEGKIRSVSPLEPAKQG